LTMDMWPPYMQATEAHVPEASDKIAFDKFPVAQHLGEAVDKMRAPSTRLCGARVMPR